MELIEISTHIKADIKTCFDLARDVDFSKGALKHNGEIHFAGKTSGLIELGDWVSWEAKHLGIALHLTRKISEFESPRYFVVQLKSGILKSIRHEYYFNEADADTTLMLDKFYFETPYGILGKFANKIFLKEYIVSVLKNRNKALKAKAELIYLNRNEAAPSASGYLFQT